MRKMGCSTTPLDLLRPRKFLLYLYPASINNTNTNHIRLTKRGGGSRQLDMSSSINKNVNVERRTWDKETYETRAKSRAAAENGASSISKSAVGNNTSGTDSDAVAAIKNEIYRRLG